jgi:urease subunit gamma/beta
MHLSPREIDKLVLHGAGTLAQKRLARGLRLNYPESVALLATVVMELIRDGRSVAELMDLGRTILGRADVMDGIPEMIAEVQVEGTFPDGTKLVTVHHPIVAEQGDLALALHGSFLPIPKRAAQPVTPASLDADVPAAIGAIVAQPGDVLLNANRDAISVEVTSRGDRPIQVGSHFPFDDVNAALSFDRAAAKGRRLDIPAGTAVRFEPGETKTVQLVTVAPLDSEGRVGGRAAE